MEIAFGTRLKELRKKRGYSQSQFAEQLDVDEKYISRLETGTSTPSFSMLVKIALILDTDLAALFKTEHLQSKEELIKNINNKILNLSDENLRIIYKIITSITD